MLPSVWSVNIHQSGGVAGTAWFCPFVLSAGRLALHGQTDGQTTGALTAPTVSISTAAAGSLLNIHGNYV